LTPLPSGHRPQLDGLRALAVFGVLLAHTIPRMQERFDAGFAGVRLFFVLSGFLITDILLRARAEAEAAGCGRARVLGAFYARRFLRIFPPYYAVLFLAAGLGLPQVRETLGWHLAYLSNVFAYRVGWPRTYLGHLWSLAVEEQFYLAWPAVVLFAPPRRLPAVVLAAVGLAPASRLLFAALGPEPLRAGVVTFSCLDTLGAGALLALVWRAGGDSPSLRPWVRRVSLAVGAALLGGMLLSSHLNLSWLGRFAGKDLAYALVFLWLVDRAAEGFGGAARHLLEARPVVYLGRISYGIYLYHEFVPALVRLLEQGLGVGLYFPAEMGVPRLVAVAAATVPLAALSWHLFEKPLNGLKSKVPYVRKEGRPPARPSPRLADARGPARCEAGRKTGAIADWVGVGPQPVLDTNRRGP
jgi:peptidoglycan/LPS O-acetylase OafA/YrhL